jgi:hypothetical protein
MKTIQLFAVVTLTMLFHLTIAQPGTLSHTTSNYNGFEVSCHGASDGSIDLTIDGGTSPYTFNWNNGTYTTQNLAGIPAGTYHVVVTDANSNTAEATVVLNEPDAIVLNLYSHTFFGVNIPCNGESTGNIDLSVNGGISPMSFNWDDGVSNMINRSNLPAGTYSLVVTDANNCTESASISLTEAPKLNLEVTNDTFVFYGHPNVNECVQLDVSASGGIFPDLVNNPGIHLYFWEHLNNDPIWGGPSSTIVCPTTDTYYYVMVKDGYGCSVSDTVLVKAFNISCGNNNDKIQVCINGSQTVCLTQNAANNVLASNPNAQLGSCEAYNKQMPGDAIGMDFSIAPNPSSGRFTLSINTGSNMASSIRVFDMLGKVVLSVPVGHYTGHFTSELDIATQPDGIYFIQVLGEGVVLHAEKVVKAN